MGDVTTELELGAQSQAARTVATALPDLETALRTSVQGIKDEATGFTGGAATHFYQAVSAWFTAGAKIPQAVGIYASNLGKTDRNVAQSEAMASVSYRRAESRLRAE